MRILIAEDDTTSRFVLENLLNKEGHEVAVALNGAEALKMLQQPDAPRLAILDWIMPEMDGLEVVRQIRQQHTERPPYIIMLTTKAEKADIITGLRAGANDYLPKPFNAGELYARIEAGRRMIEIQDALADKIAELQQTLEHIRTLRGLLPICANCKKIRNDQGYWEKVEVYIRNHTEADFTHGICPECAKKLYPELYP
ncbi:MAG: response regulator transcription factor [Desulfobacterota bacterium]|nr:response regulator transcription factor [Thermodesulfobacteriota bacterium]